MSLGELLALAVSGLVVGALARFAVPGPDPMPIWATIGFGLVGSFVGGAVGVAAAGLLGGLIVSVIAATVLILAYRRFVQKRAITGPSAKLPPR